MGIFDRYSNMFDPYQGGWEHRKAEQEKLEREYERQGYRPEEQAPDPLLDEVNQSKMMDMPVPLEESPTSEANIWGSAVANEPIKPSFNLKDSITDVNEYFSGLEGGANLSNQSTFMNRLAATESGYGSNKLGDYSYGQFQIDPVKYQDIVDRSQTGNAKLRSDAANKFLRGKLGDDNFDILSMLDVDSERDASGQVTSAKYRSNQALTDHNPLIAATLARLGLGNVSAPIPEGIVGQGQYWKDHWNKSGAGDATGSEFVRRGTVHGYGDNPQEDTPIPNLNKVWDSNY